MDHIYPISLNRVGLWITSWAINGTIKRLQSKISGLQIEQLGEDEAVLSAPVENLDDLCRAAKASKVRHLTEEQRLRQVAKLARYRFRRNSNAGETQEKPLAAS